MSLPSHHGEDDKIPKNEVGVVHHGDFGQQVRLLVFASFSRFGVATETIKWDEKPISEEGTILGSLPYLSPEQASGQPTDARSDIFSFGILLYEMVTGMRAFQRPSRAATLSAILNEDPPPIGKDLERVSHELERIVSRCLRKDRARRFQHMDDLKLAL
jgi:serine/threonine protein kinase